MESPYHSGPASSGSRPSLGFPLGTALLLLVIFSLSGVFSCCYHWEKLRRTFSLRPLGAAHDLEAYGSPGPSKPKPSNQESGKGEIQTLPVIIMPGDNVPKFIALPCPCEPLRQDEFVVHHVETPPTKMPSPTTATPPL